jgi:hypothetical protein
MAIRILTETLADLQVNASNTRDKLEHNLNQLLDSGYTLNKWEIASGFIVFFLWRDPATERLIQGGKDETK